MIDTSALLSWLPRLIVRAVQFALAVTVVGLYAHDIRTHAASSTSPDLPPSFSVSQWGYAVAVGTLAAVTSLVYTVPFVKSSILFGWDAVMFVLWTAVFGLFARKFVHEEGAGRMRSAVWIDLVNMLLWFVTAIVGAVLFFRNRRARTLHTGRAEI